MAKGWDPIQRDLHMLKRWAHEDPTMFNKAKCKVLHVGWGNPQYSPKMGDKGIESTPDKEGLGVLGMCTGAQKARCTLHCTKRRVASRSRDQTSLEQVLRMSAKMTRTLGQLSQDERLEELGLFSLEKKRFGKDLPTTFQYLNGAAR